MAAPGFGFSTGDLIGAIKLIKKTTAALSRLKGAEKQCHEASLELGILSEVLQEVQSLDPLAHDAKVVERVRYHAHACYTPLAEFLAKLHRFETHLDFPQQHQRDSNSNRIMRTGRKLQWALQFEDELKTFRAGIGTYIAMLCAMLQILALGTASTERTMAEIQFLKSYMKPDVAVQCKVFPTLSTGEKSSRQIRQNQTVTSATNLSTGVMLESPGLLQDSSTAKRRTLSIRSGATALSTGPLTPTTVPSITDEPIWAKISQEVYSLALALHQDVSCFLLLLMCLRTVLYRMFAALIQCTRSPTQLLDDNIVIYGLFGQPLSLPYAHFRYWTVTQARLRTASRGGSDTIMTAEGQFIFVDSPPGQNRSITEESWYRFVRPGDKLQMAVLPTPRRLFGRRCPQCGRIDHVFVRGSCIQCRGPAYADHSVGKEDRACCIRYGPNHVHRPRKFVNSNAVDTSFSCAIWVWSLHDRRLAHRLDTLIRRIKADWTRNPFVLPERATTAFLQLLDDEYGGEYDVETNNDNRVEQLLDRVQGEYDEEINNYVSKWREEGSDEDGTAEFDQWESGWSSDVGNGEDEDEWENQDDLLPNDDDDDIERRTAQADDDTCT